MEKRSVERSGSRRFLRRLAPKEVAALSAVGLVLLLATAVALAATGDLTQPAGTAGCVSQDGSGPCADGYALINPVGVTVSADGRSVYVASQNSDAVARLNRNTTTGAITQPAPTAGCISETRPMLCAGGHALKSPQSVAVSPDGKSVYVASAASAAVARLVRNTTTGALTQPAGSAGCVSQTGAGPCVDGHALNNPLGVAVSPDGKSVYVTSAGSDAVARLDRNTTTGAITQAAGSAGCVSETGSGPCADGHGLDNPFGVAVSPDGKSVYVGSYSSSPPTANAVARFNRNTTTGAITQPAGSAGCVSEDGSGPCTDGHALINPRSVAVSADGKNLYVASFGSNALARLVRNATTGAISQPAGSAGCVSQDGSGPCADGHALINPASVAVSADGKSVYVASVNSSAVARLNRNTTTGAITQPASTAGCVSETGSGQCADGHGLNNPMGVAVSPDGKSVYAVTFFSDDVARFIRTP
jgi:DNA-binding beta-propeller fold protein YncE